MWLEANGLIVDDLKKKCEIIGDEEVTHTHTVTQTDTHTYVHEGSEHELRLEGRRISFSLLTIQKRRGFGDTFFMRLTLRLHRLQWQVDVKAAANIKTKKSRMK